MGDDSAFDQSVHSYIFIFKSVDRGSKSLIKAYKSFRLSFIFVLRNS
jgi:hypothetical protein